MQDTDAHPLKAAFWMVGAIVSFTSMAVAGRNVAVELDTFELMMYRSFIGVAIVLVIASTAGALHHISTRSMGLHLARNISHFAGQNLWFAALSMIPLAQLFALEFTSPIWVILLAPVFLGERLTPLRGVVAGLGFLGVLIVARPDFANPDPGVILAALAAIGFAGSMIFTKRLTRTESTTCILFWLTMMQAAFGVLCAGWDLDIAWPSLTVWPWVVVVSIAGLAAHFCLTTALGLAPATVVVPLDFARLPVAALLGVVLYGEGLDLWVILGAAIIFGANYMNIALEKRR